MPNVLTTDSISQTDGPKRTHNREVEWLRDIARCRVPEPDLHPAPPAKTRPAPTAEQQAEMQAIAKMLRDEVRRRTERVRRALRKAALQRLVRTRARISVDGSGRYHVDASVLLDEERRVLFDRALDAQTQKTLADFADRRRASTPEPVIATPEPAAEPADVAFENLQLLHAAARLRGGPGK